MHRRAQDSVLKAQSRAMIKARHTTVCRFTFNTLVHLLMLPQNPNEAQPAINAPQ